MCVDAVLASCTVDSESDAREQVLYADMLASLSPHRGTPPGEGFKRKPPVFFKHGDICTVSGSHGLGSLTNPVVDESKQAAGGDAARL